MLVLGIETSCDETSVAIVNDRKEVLSNIVLSQIDEHEIYGGVVPEIAARAHLKTIEEIYRKALLEAGVTLNDIDAIAVTSGPGLIGGLIVGVMFAKGLAASANKPLIAVNHLEGHALTARLTGDVEFPFLLLLVSGGHCQILLAEGVGRFTKIGGTMDDALGEAFDKTAKLLDLGLPGGPKVETLAKNGDENRFQFPTPMVGREGADFSFSGLKTAVRREVEFRVQSSEFSEKDQSDICASFQKACGIIVADRLENAIASSRSRVLASSLVVAGGVAANQYLRNTIQNVADKNGMKLVCPPPSLCTDNAAMIAWAGIERMKLGLVSNMDFEPKARWPLSNI